VRILNFSLIVVLGAMHIHKCTEGYYEFKKSSVLDSSWDSNPSEFEGL